MCHIVPSSDTFDSRSVQYQMPTWRLQAAGKIIVGLHVTRKEKQQRQLVAEQAEIGPDILAAYAWSERLTKRFEDLAVGNSNIESNPADFYQELLVVVATVTKVLAKCNPEALRQFVQKADSPDRSRQPEPSPDVELLLKAFRIAGSTQKLAEWVQTPVPALNGETPYTMMQSEEGRKQVDAVLSRIEHGVY